MGTSDKPFRFSSRVSDDGAFGLYHDLYPVKANVALTGERFHAEAHAHQLSRMIVIDRKISGVTHDREARHARSDGFDHVVLQLVMSGQWAGGLPGEERIVRPGEIVLLDMARPQRNVASDAQLVTINLPRDQIEEAMVITPAMHAAILPASASQLLGEFMLLLMRHGAGSSAAMAASAGNAVAELAAGAFATLNGLQSSADNSIHFSHLRRKRAELFIEPRLADAELDADQIARGLGVSRTILYQLFQSSGGVARYILARRLELLGNALRRPSETRSISQLAFALGFSSESHCSKAFRSAYGMPPGQYRKQAVQERSQRNELGDAAQSALNLWHKALR